MILQDLAAVAQDELKFRTELSRILTLVGLDFEQAKSGRV